MPRKSRDGNGAAAGRKARPASGRSVLSLRGPGRGTESAGPAARPRSYAELGRLGGEAVKRTRGRAYFVELGRRGGKARKRPSSSP